jgi:5-methylcytosine-specific restriction endonuclease McrA
MVKHGLSKDKRPRLGAAEYESLRQEILWRDGWRCQSCGTMSNLEVHHTQFRSQAGDDAERNLMTVCAACHANLHSVKKQTRGS